MADSSICVQDTDYCEYFENAGKNTIFLLSEEEAQNAWESEICTNSLSYFDLPDDCWVVAHASNSIGYWIEAYNSDDNAAVANLLLKNINWPDDTIIKFFAKKKIVFQAKWCDFLRFWDEFIAVEDDCPIIIPEGDFGKQALVFRPIGDILKIS